MNWAHVISECELVTGLTPSQSEIESALQLVEDDMTEDELLTKEAEELEENIVTRLLKVIPKIAAKILKKPKLRKNLSRIKIKIQGM